MNEHDKETVRLLLSFKAQGLEYYAAIEKLIEMEHVITDATWEDFKRKVRAEK